MTRGRPRKNDPQDVLDKALTLFWKNGFTATSMNDLSEATGMAKPGLYANFGNKNELFEKALRAYFDEFAKGFAVEFVVSQKPLKEDLQQLLNNVIERANEGPCSGCFLLNTVVETADNPSEIYDLGRELSNARHDVLVTRLQNARSRGELPADADMDQLAKFISGQMLAIAALASEGTDRESLQQFATTALKALPFIEH